MAVAGRSDEAILILNGADLIEVLNGKLDFAEPADKLQIHTKSLISSSCAVGSPFDSVLILSSSSEITEAFTNPSSYPIFRSS